MTSKESPEEIAKQKAAVEARKKARLAKKAVDDKSDAAAQKAAVEARKKARLAKQAAEDEAKNKKAAAERQASVEKVRRARAIKVAERKSDAAVEKVKAESKARMAKVAAEKAAAAALRSYTVKSGDTLGAIAQAMLGNANRYNEIFEANKDTLSSPSAIFPGQELKIPAE